jgi:hypothetical protein
VSTGGVSFAAMRGEIETRHELNLQRVHKLVQAYRDLAGPGPGRRSVETIDLLRAAVVFLHASLEDVLRTLLERRWPLVAAPEHFEDIPIATEPSSRQTKVTLVDLARHRGKTIDQLVQESIEAHLDRTTFNNVGDIKTALVRCGLDPRLIHPHASAIAAMMSRRHQIVHRADRRDARSAGKQTVLSLRIANRGALDHGGRCDLQFNRCGAVEAEA